MAEKPTYEELENRNQELEQAASQWKQAEKALRQSEEKYRTYIEHANDGISVVQKRKFVFVNSRLAEIMGFKVDELEGKDFLQFIPKDKLNQIADNLKRRLAGEEVPQVYESRILHKDSREIDVEFNVTTIEFNDEPATLTITRDITERKQAEEALQTREKLINALLNNQIDAATVVDKELKMLYVNKCLADRFGRSVDEMIGLSPEDVGDKADIVTAKRVAYFKQVATTGQPVRFEDKRGEIWFDTVVTPVLDKDGQVSQVAILARDITDKKKIEQALVESEEKYRGLVETMAEGLAIQDENGLIIYVNNRFCKMAGYQQHEVIGKKIIDLLDERNKQIVKGEIAKRRKGVPAHSYETEITRKDGRQISVFLSPRDILDSDGQFKGSFAVFTDISFRIQAEEALKKAHDHLERRVEDRTADLAKVNRSLEEEIVQRKYAWEKLKHKEKELKNKTTELRETNTALNVLLKRREMDKEEVEEKVVSNVKALIQPYLKKLKKTKLTPNQDVYLNILQSNIGDILSPFLRNLAIRYSGLTPKEIEVGSLVKEGKNTKEIADLMNTTKRAVEFHRHSLREKLGLKNTKANLRSYLMSLP